MAEIQLIQEAPDRFRIERDRSVLLPNADLYDARAYISRIRTDESVILIEPDQYRTDITHEFLPRTRRDRR